MDILQTILEDFTYHEKWNFGVLYFILLTIALYFFLLPTSPTHTRLKSGLFVLGLFIYFFALGSPLNLLGRIQFRAHMIQMIMLFFLSAPLLAIGLKGEFLKKAISVPFLDQLLLRLMKPTGSLILFHVLFISYHIPVIFDYVRINLFLHYFYLFAMFVVALIFWCAIFPPIKELNRLTNKHRKIYYMGYIILFIPLAAVFFLSKQSFYSIYTDMDLIITSLELCLPLGELAEPIIEEDLVEALLPFPPQREQVVGSMILFTTQLASLCLYTFIKNAVK
ncbi:cytochrome c oxidase assembly protein [Bacillus sp. AK128]